MPGLAMQQPFDSTLAELDLINAGTALEKGGPSPATPAVPAPQLFRSCRTCYPGSKFGPKSRYDLPQRQRAFVTEDSQVEDWLGSSSAAAALSLISPRRPSGNGGVSGGADVLGGAARSMFQNPLVDRHLSERALVHPDNDAHGIMLLGAAGSGKTSLIWSLLALQTGSFPSRHDIELQKKKSAEMPTFGLPYELPERHEVRAGDVTKMARIILTDTAPCGPHAKDGNPICVSVSPNSTQHFNAIPSWMRITLRGGSYPHFGLLVVVDALATPLWEDDARCRDLARLMAVLRRSQYTVAIAVTKLHRAREIARREANYGVDHGRQVGRDPHSSYETFVSRYIGKTCAALQAKAKDNDWSFSQGADAPAFPLNNATIFDVPTWTTVGEYAKWQERKGTSELPNFKYFTSQLRKLLLALSYQPPPEI